MPSSQTRTNTFILIFLTSCTHPMPTSEPQSMPEYLCHRTDEPLIIDGRLDEPVWSTAEVVRDFGLIDKPDERPSLYLEVRALWDAENLYLAFVADASPVPVTMTQRNEALFNECAVELFVASDDGGFYEIEFNSLNAILDFHNPAGTELPWTELASVFEVAGLQSAVGWSPDRLRWTLEATLPFASLPAAVDRPWRINFARSQRMPDDSFELATWAPTRSTFADVPRFGSLQLVP